MPPLPNPELSDIFTDLSSTDIRTRRAAAIALRTKLQTSNNNAEDPSTDINHPLKRLVRGLSSSREGSRQGFALALTELLCEFPSITQEQLAALESEFLTFTDKKSRYSRDKVLGKLLYVLSLIQSNRLTPPTASFADINKAITELLELSKAREYTQPMVYEMIILLLSKFTITHLSSDEGVKILKMLLSGTEKYSPEQLMIIIWLETTHKGFIGKHVDAKLKDINLRNVLVDYKPILFEDALYTHPLAHPVWDRVIGVITASKDESLFKQLWTQIEEMREGDTQLANLSMRLLAKLAVHLSASGMLDWIPIDTLTNVLLQRQTKLPKQISDTIYEAVKADPQYHMRLCSALVELVPNSVVHGKLRPLFNFASLEHYSHILTQLFALPSRLRNDNAKLKCVERLDYIKDNVILSADEDVILKVLMTLLDNAYFKKSAADTEMTDDAAEIDTDDRDDDDDEDIDNDESTSSRLIPSIRKACESRFHRLLGTLVTKFPRRQPTGSKQPTDSTTAETSDAANKKRGGEAWLEKVLDHAQQMERTADSDHSLVKPFSATDLVARKCLNELLADINAKIAEITNVKHNELYQRLTAFKHITIHFLLFQYKDPAAVTESTHDVIECYRNLFGYSFTPSENLPDNEDDDEDEEVPDAAETATKLDKKALVAKAKANKGKANENESESDSESESDIDSDSDSDSEAGSESPIAPIDVFVNLVLGLLSKMPKRPVFAAVKSAVYAFGSLFTEAALTLMLKQLSGDNPAVEEGIIDTDDEVEEIIGDLDEDSDVDATEAESDANTSNVDAANENGAAQDAKSKSGKDDNEKGSDDSDDEDESAALNDEEMLDDDAMFQQDRMIAEVFRQRKLELDKKIEAKVIATDFKLLVIELVEQFINTQKSNPLILNAISALYTLIVRDSAKKRSRTFVERSRKIIKHTTANLQPAFGGHVDKVLKLWRRAVNRQSDLTRNVVMFTCRALSAIPITEYTPTQISQLQKLTLKMIKEVHDVKYRLSAFKNLGPIALHLLPQIVAKLMPPQGVCRLPFSEFVNSVLGSIPAAKAAETLSTNSELAKVFTQMQEYNFGLLSGHSKFKAKGLRHILVETNRFYKYCRSFKATIIKRGELVNLANEIAAKPNSPKILKVLCGEFVNILNSIPETTAEAAATEASASTSTTTAAATKKPEAATTTNAKQPTASTTNSSTASAAVKDGSAEAAKNAPKTPKKPVTQQPEATPKAAATAAAPQTPSTSTSTTVKTPATTKAAAANASAAKRKSTATPHSAKKQRLE